MRQKKISKLVVHLIVCLFFLSFPAVFFTKRNGGEVINFILTSPFYWLFGISFGSLFYFNLYYLATKFYCRKKYIKYFGAVVLIYFGFHFMQPFEFLIKDYFRYFKLHEGEISPYQPFQLDIFSNIFFTVVIALSLAIRVAKQWQKAEKRTLEAEKRTFQAEADKAKAELSFLKNQINPHFLFNTLNNIYSLSIIQDAKTSLSILKLSNLMRYIADDATKNFISLEREVSSIRDCIDLQKLRLDENMHLEFSVTGNTENKTIAPLILMSFVENAFKYGVTTREPATITIKLFADEQKIMFFCQNKIFVHKHHIETTGIGLSNTRQRLKLIYPKKHTLEIDEQNDSFTVQLTLLT
jgi:two-component system LytT family sensor kinase